MTFVGNFFREFTKDRSPKKFSTRTKDQDIINQLISQAITSGEGPLAGLVNLDPAASAERYNQAVAQPLITQFNEEILPGITGQFRGSGLGNSTFAGQASARAGEGLERQLASGLAQYQGQQEQNIMNNIMNLLGLRLNQQEFGFKEQTPNLFAQGAVGFAQGAGQGVGRYVGGGMGG